MNGPELVKRLSDTIVATKLLGYVVSDAWDTVWIENEDKVITIGMHFDNYGKIRDDAFTVYAKSDKFASTIEELKKVVIDLL